MKDREIYPFKHTLVVPCVWAWEWTCSLKQVSLLTPNLVR